MFRNQRRSGALRALLLLGTLALAAVAAFGTTANAGTKATKPPLILFQIFQKNSPLQGKNYSALNGGAGAAVLAINRAGGINGRRVVLNGCDDNTEINRAVACARQAVSLGAWAVIGSSSLYTAAMGPILKDAGIPYVGGWLNSESDARSDIHYPVAGVGSMLYAGVAYAMRYAGAKKVSIMALDVAASRALAVSTKAAIERTGASHGVTVTVPVSVTDYSPYLQAIRNAGSDGLIVTARSVDALGLISAASQLGINNIKWGITVGGMSVDQFNSMGSQKANVVGAGYWPPSLNIGNSAGMKKFVAEVKAAQRAKIGYASLRSPLTINGWVDPWALALLAKKRPAATNSSRALITALNAQKAPIDLFGLAQWAPGAGGPDAYPRVSNGTLYYTKINKNGLWYRTSRPVDIFKVLGLK